MNEHSERVTVTDVATNGVNEHSERVAVTEVATNGVRTNGVRTKSVKEIHVAEYVGASRRRGVAAKHKAVPLLC